MIYYSWPLIKALASHGEMKFYRENLTQTRDVVDRVNQKQNTRK